MPCEGRNIQLSDIERSEDKNLIRNLLKLGMLVLVQLKTVMKMNL